MKNEIKRNLIVVLFGGMLVYAISFASAAFTEPTGGAPTNNVDSPITVLSPQQAKNGGLSIGTFLANGIAEFQQKTFFPGSLKGQDATGADVALKVGGTDAATSAVKYVDTTATGNVHTEKTLGSVELVTADKRKLCADDQGHIVFCPQIAPTVLTMQGFGAQSMPVQGGTANTNVVCDVAISGPAPEDISISIGYWINLDQYQNSSQSTPRHYCTVLIRKGTASGDDYPGRELSQGTTNVEVTDTCYDSNNTFNNGTTILDDSGTTDRC